MAKLFTVCQLKGGALHKKTRTIGEVKHTLCFHRAWRLLADNHRSFIQLQSSRKNFGEALRLFAHQDNQWHSLRTNNILPLNFESASFTSVIEFADFPILEHGEQRLNGPLRRGAGN